MPNKVNLELVQKIKGDLKGSNGVVLADFKGMTVLELSALRKKVRKDGGSSKILKNTLLRIALNETSMPGMDSHLKENTIVFSSKDDVMRLLKVLADYAKDNEKFKLKAGFVDGSVLDKDSVIAMSKMPSRKELLSMIVGNMSGMISSFVGTLNGIMTTFIGTIEALEKKKQ
jgi:large subunit ribosomal protein L10